MYSMRFDMRAPDFGAPAVELYEAAVDMCEWAETRGCMAAVICEHHGSPDGYLPTPLILGSAIAARTKQLMMTLIVILPFYDPVRLAEEIAVLDLISKGRATYVFGLGYRPEEYEMFGVDLKARGRIADDKLDMLRRLLAGEVVEREGRRIRLTPLPLAPQGPLMMWGGGSKAAARRAGRYGLGYLAQGDAPGSLEAYEEACRAHGHEPGMTLLPTRDTPSVCFVAPDVDTAWREIGAHLLHDARTYAEWNPDNETSAGIADVRDVDELRATSRTHRIFAADEAVAHVRSGGMLTLAPLCGGIPPDIAWKYLRYVDEAVMPALRGGAG
ncbi:LLM class flavin-dependent oxidoreductase [Candidatus Mycobacterium wuenschmannii]|uniref:LLM class flavin-dependent oxidoreductase n=1 Tax=Candidatus Mycobacterium wuenschmannii TaxID=3027808 RepID=A0ABY8VZ30_9MYCO|nr:LLM class flavin-dependent oxidoreductase [Candidatus Mycobacterium wuenschmannii]WIM88908.1 LLM class flavin-dependent oxidoreductase [Candidatus Mycobacterium wuenschmannii]